MKQQEPEAKSHGYKWGVIALAILAVITAVVVVWDRLAVKEDLEEVKGELEKASQIYAIEAEFPVEIDTLTKVTEAELTELPEGAIEGKLLEYANDTDHVLVMAYRFESAELASESFEAVKGDTEIAAGFFELEPGFYCAVISDVLFLASGEPDLVVQVINELAPGLTGSGVKDSLTTTENATAENTTAVKDSLTTTENATAENTTAVKDSLTTTENATAENTTAVKDSLTTMENVPALPFTETFGGEEDDRAYAVQQTTDGGYIIAGRTESFGAGDWDVYLVKTDGEGNEEWYRTFGDEAYDIAYAVQQTTDGGYIIAGYTESFGAGGWDVYLVKTDGEGNEEWYRTFGGAGYDVAWSVQQTTNGGYIIAGFTTSFGAGSSDAYLVKTDEEGNEEWYRTFGGVALDAAFSVQQTADGGYIIAGYTDSYGEGGDAYLVKTDGEGVVEERLTVE